jgi:hypothetical protein
MNAANQLFIGGSYTRAAEGLWPREYSIPKGVILYRFINTSKEPPEAGADGPWWFEFDHFQTIRQFSIRHGYSLGYAARLFAAILYEWSEVNAFVRAEVKAPLFAWKGKGKQITVKEHEKGDSRDQNRTPHGFVTEASPQNVSKMTPLQGALEVYQLYIPGMGLRNGNFKVMFDYIEHEPIQTG